MEWRPALFATAVLGLLPLACGGDGFRWTATPAPAQSPGTGGDGAAPAPGCDPAYPTLCIRPPPPDLDCADVAASSFVVRPPDPHRLDRDGNGLGCEGG